MKISNVKLLFALAAFAVLFLASKDALATGIYPHPGCSLETKAGDIKIDFSDGRMLSTTGSVYTFNYSANIPAGDYEVKLESYDGYSGRDKVTQPREKYFVKFTNGGSEVAKSGSTEDLPDFVERATWKGTVNEKIAFSSKVDKVTTVHSHYPDNSSPNSVAAACMVLRLIPQKIDGKCGLAHKQTLETKPSENLCASGTPSIVLGTDKWIWTCYGINGGSGEYCEAYPKPEKIDGKCGDANGQTFTNKPVANLCSIGNASEVSLDGEKWNWSCAGLNGGSNAQCAANYKKEENPICGNKVVETGEQCDDGNILNGDGCSSICMNEKKEEPKKDDDEDCDGSIGDFVWLDKNGNGKQDKDEPGLSGIKVTLKSGDDEWENRTSKYGKYKFEDLCEGEYSVRVKDKDVASYAQTFDPDGNLNNKTDVKLKGDNDSHMKADFGYRAKALPKTGSGIAITLIAGLASVAGVAYKRKK